MRLLTSIPHSPDLKLMAEALKAYLEGIVLVNRVILRTQPMPELYKSGVRFRSEPSKQQWDYVPNFLALIEQGYGDCAPLTAARVAELQHAGERASVKVYWRPERSPIPFHAQVRRADGTVEDPSRLLGMAGAHYE